MLIKSSILHLQRCAKIYALCITMLLSSGCSVIYKTTGDVIVGFGKDEMLPHMLSTTDADMACTSGEAFTPFIEAFKRVGSKTDQLEILLYVVAASCAEDQALQAELESIRALRAGRIAEAQDARIKQKRAHRTAAFRQYTAYQRINNHFGSDAEKQCPTFKKDLDELTWLVAQLAALQSIINDVASDSSIGIPKNLAAKVDRNAACLDSKKWWGAPSALRAAVWSILPQIKPEGANTWQALNSATAIGNKSGVRLANTMYIIAAHSKGDKSHLRTAIKSFADARKTYPVNPEYAMLDTIAERLALSISDKLWTESTGKRTPFNRLGTFWDEKPKVDDINIDDLL